MKWWDVRLNFFFSLPASCHREMNILSCQEEKVMRLVLSLSLCFSLHLCLSEADGLVHRTKESCFIVITENILSWSQKHLLYYVGRELHKI